MYDVMQCAFHCAGFHGTNSRLTALGTDGLHRISPEPIKMYKDGEEESFTSLHDVTEPNFVVLLEKCGQNRRLENTAELAG